MTEEKDIHPDLLRLVGDYRRAPVVTAKILGIPSGKKQEPILITCPKCGNRNALGNYKHNPHFGKCPDCHQVFGVSEKRLQEGICRASKKNLPGS